MSRAQPIKARHGKRSGELIVTLPPGWELRLRRVLRELMGETLPDTRALGLTPAQRDARRRLRQRQMRDAMCYFVTELITADIVGKEIALATRGRFGCRGGSLREHVAAILREATGGR
ncbi:MAG: hypothetical protein AB7V27_15460 [Candidatus Binatia bacterium]